MTIQNDFLPFATSSSANVSTQSDFAALAALTSGFSAGIAKSAQMNKVWRQSSIMSAVLAAFIVDQSGQAAVDDGTTATLKANLLAAIKAAVSTSFTSQVGFQQDLYTSAIATGTADAIVAAFSPAITSTTLASGTTTLTVRATAANATTTPTFTPNSGVVAAATIVKGANQALVAGDIAGAGHWITLQWDATLSKWVLLNPATGIAVPSSSFRNLLINGCFRVNQLGYVSGTALATGVPSSGVGYGHDGWRAGASGCTYTFTQSKGPTQITITAGSLISVAEDVDVIGGAYVLSWSGTAQARVGINGAAPSGSYASSPILISAAGGGQTISVEFNTGTLGSVQLESGSNPTSTEWPDYQKLLARCQRQLPCFLAGVTGELVAEGMVYQTTQTTHIIRFPVPARAPITGIISSPASNFFVQLPNGSQVPTAIAIGTGGSNTTRLSVTVSGFTAGYATQLIAGVANLKIVFTGAQL